MSETNHSEMVGWLFKWTNYLKGYQRRWFVLSNGMLSYYKNQAEMSHTCRGTISLQGALIHTENSCMFVISNGGSQTFHIKASNEVDRQRWITALELAKAKTISEIIESEVEDDSDYDQKYEMTAIMNNLSSHLEDIHTCNELINEHGAALQSSLSELETNDFTRDISEKIKAITEKVAVFMITSDDLTNTCSVYQNLAQEQAIKWQKLLQHEKSQKRRLEEMVKELAKQHSIHVASGNRFAKLNSSPSDDDEDSSEFFECEESVRSTDTSNIVNKVPISRRNSNWGEPSKYAGETEVIVNPKDSEDQTSTSSVNKIICKWQRRTRVPNKPDYPLNLWSIVKNCVGKELSKIPMPVNFSEPLSMLQRLAEDYEYSKILDNAANLTDSQEQLAYVAAFTISSYSTTSNRIGKPFNPLLGETYECDRRDDLGWRLISEQVSHHPPMLAQHCEGKEWTCWQEFTMLTKFRGKYLQIIPLGTSHLQFHTSGNHYTWRKVTTTVHNIIVGKLWVDQHGDMDIICHTDGSKCRLSYIPHSYFNRDTQRKVKGCVMDKNGKVSWIVRGTWDTKIEVAPATGIEGKSDKDPVYNSGPYSVAWERQPPPPDCDKYYNFTIFACQLNEPEDGVAPTDSRRRPDQRFMEEGKWDEANAIKIRLEQQQRAAAGKARVTSGGQPPPSQPAWFKKEADIITGNPVHVYKGDYWICKEKADWSRCPKIF